MYVKLKNDSHAYCTFSNHDPLFTNNLVFFLHKFDTLFNCYTRNLKYYELMSLYNSRLKL
jgi:hypothetical protein